MSEKQTGYNVPAVRDAAPPAPLRFTPEKIDLLKRTICKGSSDDELELFLYVCERTGLDPFLRQIHAVLRYDKKAGRKVMSIQTGIDGYRLMADRTQRYAGNDEPVYIEHSSGDIVSATVTVYKLVGGKRCPFTATARWDEYKQTKTGGGLTFMWVKMPHLMLAKCAEALALRKAFPAELSGIYTNTEMMQADVIEATVTEIKDEPEDAVEHIIVNGKWTKMPPRPLKPAQLKEVLEFNASKKGWDEPASEGQVGLAAGRVDEVWAGDKGATDNRHEFTGYIFGKRSMKALTKGEASVLLDWLLDKADSTGEQPFRAYAVEEANLVLRQAMLDQGQQELPAEPHVDMNGNIYGKAERLIRASEARSAAQFDAAPQEQLDGLGFARPE